MPYKRGKKWVGTLMYQKKRYTNSKCITKREAMEWESWKRRVLEGGGSKSQRVATVFDLAERYLDYSQQVFSRQNYLCKVRSFKALQVEIDPSTPLDQVLPSDVLTVSQRLLTDRSGAVANEFRKKWIAAWNWGTKYLNDMPRCANPFLVEKMPEKKRAKYVPPVKDLYKVIDAVSTEQDEAMLWAQLHLAARPGEIFKLKWVDVDFANQQARLWTSKRKGGNTEADWVPISDVLYDILLEQRQRSDSEYVFICPVTGDRYKRRQIWFDRLCVRAKVKRFTMHALRHLSASILSENGVPIRTIQAILRHRSLATTERYLHELGSANRDALKALPGKRKGKTYNKTYRNGRQKATLHVVGEND